ncbi:MULTISPECIES: histone deacetylase [unclassified Kitasatospora]|uniref:histone deacetylase n=1 Tax=unclassified Kitasatospora TaxID=2633591 RepID=UPI003403B787
MATDGKVLRHLPPHQIGGTQQAVGSEVRRAEPLAKDVGLGDLVWYAAYGSNLHADRLAYYIAGGRPPGGARTYPGCRDRRLPKRQIPVVLPGLLYFALTSRVWTGGMGFYDPAEAGEMPARAYLVTQQQFSDIAAQEMHREPGADLDLSKALVSGHDQLGPGRYETLVCPGAIDGIPAFTFTAPWRLSDAELNSPANGYLANIAAGLAEAHGWSLERSASYLATRPGAAGHWTSEGILNALRTVKTEASWAANAAST